MQAAREKKNEHVGLLIVEMWSRFYVLRHLSLSLSLSLFPHVPPFSSVQMHLVPHLSLYFPAVHWNKKDAIYTTRCGHNLDWFGVYDSPERKLTLSVSL